MQKTVLILGNKGEGGVTPVDVKVAYYGFPLRPKGTKIFFDKKEVGFTRYNNASVAIARVFDLLARKGLAERIHNYGVILTVKGIELARQIKANN
ncbi:hypothetical protein ACFL5J_01490 [Thermodesulfobacteriota bacterium]